ncbi:aromatic ring-hydroxylating dioxygenase subunit alpha [Pseudomonas sp. CC120222-01a]|uniref:aromatic ring-hydroxylating dioxygenase subunit alpha n=1 Tax=Pseudomonas sp. CC120222-01a TaxID=1378075 RepID=UPI000D9A59C1|nr:aromatic ring-hydroxylating dioxygenase subunit alpha [Pseudomonas sp. CC120222-01a]PVZ42529.1 vanillate O-demethylase monooxygenase subunit [Pseudomonas sp. CC120222-01a]
MVAINDIAVQQIPTFPLNRWYVAGFSWELKNKPLARVLLGHSVVLFRLDNGHVSALEDRCCHRSLPLSHGTLEAHGLRCGYHGLLFDGSGVCVEIPGQNKIPEKARVSTFHVREVNQIIWMWFGEEKCAEPTHEPPEYAIHDDDRYLFRGDVVHYDAPYQLIHDNLLDLSHLGYVHLQTIGGNAHIHMNAKMQVHSDGEVVRVVRHLPDSDPPPTYVAAYPFTGKVDRWQEIEFHVSHLLIWTGAVAAGTASLSDPDRDGFHMRGFHGITPESETTSHYFWTMATNPASNEEQVLAKVIEQTELTFEEDRVVIEAQYKNLVRFDSPAGVDIHVDVGANRARRLVELLRRNSLSKSN